MAPLTLAVPRRVFCRFLRCLPGGLLAGAGQQSLGDGARGGTYAAGATLSRAWWPCRHGSGGTGARTSSWPQASRRPGRSRWSCHHRTGCADRRRSIGPCWPCRDRQSSRGAAPWRCWGGRGAECHYERRICQPACSAGRLFLSAVAIERHVAKRFVSAMASTPAAVCASLAPPWPTIAFVLLVPVPVPVSVPGLSFSPVTQHPSPIPLFRHSTRARVSLLVVAPGVGRTGGRALIHRVHRVSGRATHTTICLRPSRGLRMNLRVRRVTGLSESAILSTILSGR